ncbi:MAG: hypothetical protein ACF8PG_05975 [Maioricimonas sp. JB045]
MGKRKNIPTKPRADLKLGLQWLATHQGTCRHCALPRFAHAGEQRTRCPRDVEELMATEEMLSALLDDWRAIVQPVTDFHEYLLHDGRQALRRSQDVPQWSDSLPTAQEMIGEIRLFREHMIAVADHLAERQLNRRRRKA